VTGTDGSGPPAEHSVRGDDDDRDGYTTVDDTLGEGEQPGAVLHALNSLEAIVSAHTEWLKDWHLDIIEGLSPQRRGQVNPPPLELPKWIEDPVLQAHPDHQMVCDSLRALQAQAEQVAAAVRTTGAIPTAAYSTFMNTVLAFASAVRQLQNDTWNQLANIDPLTGLGNRRAMWRKLRIEVERQARNRHAFCIAMLDLDFFKEVNDGWGHGAGDMVLQRVASMLTASVRPYDSIFRFGGDEFLLCLPSTDLRAAWAIIDRLRLKVSLWPIELRQGSTIRPSLSVGIAPVEWESGVDVALERADAALYQAKRNGRNCVYVWREPSPNDPPTAADQPALNGVR
jgi:diguanylate cyclase